MDIDLDQHNKLRDEVVAHAYELVGYTVLHSTQNVNGDYPADELANMFRKTEEALYIVAGGKAALMRRCEQLSVELEDERQKVAMLEVIS